MTFITAQSRQELKDSLEDWMSESYEILEEDQKLAEGQTQLKSYLIESNLDNVSEEHFNNGVNVNIRETDEDDFYVVKLANETKSVDFHLEILDDRFWLFHTIAERNDADPLVKKLINPRFTQLDRPWLPTGFLNDIADQHDTTFQSFSLSYNNEFRDNNGSYDIDRLSMRLWSETAGPVWAALRENEEIRGSTPLSNVGIKRRYDEKTMIDNITFYSKFTAKGDSVDGHFEQITSLRDKYRGLLKKIEDEYSISHKSNEEGGELSGEPLTINFDKRITDVENFISALFSSKEPFRLWGVKNRIDEDYYRISSVDLHTGDKLTLETSPEWVRIYLPEDSCGNVVLRLFTNIQHHFDSEADLEVGNGDALI